MNDLIPAWVAAIHGHAYSIEEIRPGPPWMPRNPYTRATCSCGWKGELELYEEYDYGLTHEWNEHVLYAIATTVRV